MESFELMPIKAAVTKKNILLVDLRKGGNIYPKYNK